MNNQYARFDAAIDDMKHDIARRSLMNYSDSEVEHVGDWVIGVKSVDPVTFEYAIARVDGRGKAKLYNQRVFVNLVCLLLQ